MSFKIDGSLPQKHYGEEEVLVLPADITKIDKFTLRLNRFTEKVKKVVLPEGLTEIVDNCFSRYKCLEEVKLPSTLKKIGEGAFCFCESLAEIDLPEGLENIGKSAFAFCKSLTSVRIPAGIKTLEKGVFSGCVSLESAELPEGLESIADEAFQFCTSLAEINIPASVSEIAPKTFYKCEKYLSSEKCDARIPKAAFLTLLPYDGAASADFVCTYKGQRLQLVWKAYSAEEALSVKQEAERYEIEYTGDPRTRFGDVGVSRNEDNIIVCDGHFWGYKAMWHRVYDSRPNSGKALLPIGESLDILTDCDTYPYDVKTAYLKRK